MWINKTVLILFCISIFSVLYITATPFSATWNTSKTSIGSSNASRIKLPLESTGAYTVDWGFVYQNISFTLIDSDNDNLYAGVEWVAPHLSSQTFEIIVITKAIHLDENKNYIEDIYEQVKTLDNVWSETISDGDYVRITFEQKLDNTKDITLYPRVVSGTPKIEVYEKDGTTKITEFTNLNSNKYNKIYLTNLQGTQDTFDLKVIGGSIEFDHIIDPDTAPNITYDGAYTVYTFYANGTFVPPVGVTNASILIVAGGGGGGSRHGGGGGGGGLIYNNSYAINGSNITVIVGIGGSRGWYAQNIGCDGIKGNGCPGQNSTFGTLTAIGGGGGKTYDGGNANGGSGGGGAGMQNTAPGSGTAGQGNNGGAGCSNPSAGGGGGAGSVGIGCTGTYNGGNGGNGLNYSINGTNFYYAGGGGGAGESGYSGGVGGTGGGGHGGNLGSDNGGSNGTTNTGGGGGGTRSILATEPGFFGGSGIITVRFLTAIPDTIYPIFSDYKDNSANLVDNGIGLFNVTVENTNGTVLLEINNTNITATNLTANVYNASYNFTNSGVYPYRWHSWGNGTSHNYNKSDERSYTVNVAYTLINPQPGTDLKLESESSVDITVTGQSGIVEVLIGLNSTSGNYSGILTLNFTQNIDVSAMTLNTSRELAKSVVHSAAGLASFINLSLLIPNVDNNGTVYICPGAETIDQVNSSCTGYVEISTGQTINGMTMSEVTYDAENYYLVENVTGTGGGEAPATTTNPMSCYFIHNESCPAGTGRLIGLENDTRSYNNAHAENNSYHNYNYSICCNTTNTSITISGACPENITVMNLSNATNAHIDISGSSLYTVPACLGSNWKRVYCSYPNSTCAYGYSCVASLAGSEGSNITNAHIGECDAYDQKVCCALVNSPPTKPVLTYPTNANNSVDERRPNFQWDASTDLEGDSIYYVFNLNCINCSAGCYQPTISGITNTTRQMTSALCVDLLYNWTVTACDKYDECNDSLSFNFTIPSVANLEVLVNTTFGQMSIGQNNDTTDNSPNPIVVRNIGNVRLNVTVNATQLFSTANLDTTYYQFKADHNESSSFTDACSQTTFANMNSAAQKIYCFLLYEDNADEGQIELNVTVPLTEPPGTKTSQIEIGCVSAD